MPIRNKQTIASHNLTIHPSLLGQEPQSTQRQKTFIAARGIRYSDSQLWE
jgi:hypothetical protein